MNRADSNQKITVPQWQSEKMKMIIADRWEEVWRIIEAREKGKRQSIRSTIK